MSIALANRIADLGERLGQVEAMCQQQATLLRLLVDKRDPKLKTALEAIGTGEESEDDAA